MAKLKTFQRNLEAMSAGEWVTVGMGEDQFEIRTRGLTAVYRDKVNAMRRNAAREANRKLPPGSPAFNVDDLPPTVSDSIAGQVLAEVCFIDVRGLTMEDANGAEQPVTADQFKALLREPDAYPAIINLTISAANQVGDARRAEAKAAEGNSSTASATA